MANHPIQNIKTEADYITAAKALPQDHLGNAFGGGDFEELTRAEEIMAKIKATALELGTHSGSAEGVIVTGVGLKRQNEQEENAKGGKSGQKGKDTINLITLLDSIANREAAFEARDGDAWREIAAQVILEPDEIPQREEGETLGDYRERVEAAIIDKMIDPETGNVKDEYLNSDDPRVKEIAEWAQEKYDEGKIRQFKQDMANPDLTDEEKRALIEEYNQSSTASRRSIIEVLSPEQADRFGLSNNNDENIDLEGHERASADAFSNNL